MSKEATREQIFELFGEMRSGRIGKWALQGLLEDAPRIAFKYLAKKICGEAAFSSDNLYETASTKISIASITRDPVDVKAARDWVTSGMYHMWYYPHDDARILVDLASLTREWRDVEPIKKAIIEGRFGGYYLVKGCLLAAEVTDERKLVDRALDEASKIDDPYLHTRALVAIHCVGRKDVDVELEKILHRIIELSPYGAYEAVKIYATLIHTDSAPLAVERARRIASRIDNAGKYACSFAAIAAATREPEDLELAYAAAHQEPKHETWRAMARVLAGID